MQVELVFLGDYQSNHAKAPTEPGKWYIGCSCQNCGRDMALIDEPTRSGDVSISGDARFQLACPQCLEVRDYPLEAMRPFRTVGVDPGGPPGLLT